MAVTFGVPPEAENNRTLIEQRLAEVVRDQGGPRVTVDWRGEQKHLHVISVPIDMVYFNPDTHRIRPLFSLDPERNAVLERAPWSEEAQDYLQHLLTRTPGSPDQIDPDYTALMDELDESGQRDPGIITREGILVDGNTRCAALRQLGERNIRVGVLPTDTSRQDINSVELSLQLRRDKRREYSYIARLIAIEEQLAVGRRAEDVARDFNIKPKTLQQDMWVYGLVKEAIERSRSAGGAALREVDFEDHQEKLRELQRDYEALAKTDPEAAQQLKESRLAAVVLSFPKTSVRLIKVGFHSEYLDVDGRLAPEVRPTVQAEPAAVAIPGLAGVSVPDAGRKAREVRALTDSILKAKAVAQGKAGETTEAVRQADALIKSVRTSYGTALKMAGQNAEYQQRQSAVPERLTDAAEYVKQCAREFAEAKAKRALDEDAFDDALLELRRQLQQLAKLAGRSFTSPSDGVAWLLEAAKER
jgi:hypothetical protein